MNLFFYQHYIFSYQKITVNNLRPNLMVGATGFEPAAS